MIVDKLIDKIIRMDNPATIGIDTDFGYLPESMTKNVGTLKAAAAAILDFNKAVIDSVCDIAPSVKVQAAYYEQYGVEGMRVFAETLSYAKAKGLITIADIKRNDIGATAAAYSKAYLSGVEINGQRLKEYECDFVTINGYLGTDGLKPFVDDCVKYDKGMFVLVKTSNPSSGELQDRTVEASGKKVYEEMADIVAQLGKGNDGKHGYNRLGAVVGATYPRQAQELRAAMPNTFFLVPGYGAQGGTAEGLKVCFDDKGLGAVVNSSRGILCAYKADKYKGQDFCVAARNAAIDMRADLQAALSTVVR